MCCLSRWLQLAQALILLLADLAGGDLRPQLDDAGDVVHRQLGRAELFELLELTLNPHLLTAQLRDAGIARVKLLLGQLLAFFGLGGHERLALEGDVFEVAFELHPAVDVLIVQVHVGAGLVDEVDGLIGQEAVGDVPLGEHDGLAQDALGDLHAVEALVVVGDALEDLERVLHARLVDR